jgi:hypothetical protein
LREDHRVVSEPGPELVSLGGRAFPVARAIAQRADEPHHDRARRNTNGLDEYVVERGQGDRRPLAWQPGQAEQVGQGGLLLVVQRPDPHPAHGAPRGQPTVHRLPQRGQFGLQLRERFHDR